MARARNLKPSIFKNEVLGTSDPLYTILFEGLWCNADREGRLEDRPMRIKAEVFPYRDGIDMDAMLNWLANHKFIIRYVANSEKYIEIINFKKHQNPHVKEHASTIPAPDLNSAQPGDSGTDRALTLNPLTLTLNPITTLSGKPDGSDTQENKKRNGKELRIDAIEVLSFLNEKAGRNYQPVPANLDLIIARLKEGFTPKQMRQVIAKKSREWLGNEKMDVYCRPKTLFNKTNFANYAGELVPVKEAR